MHNSVFHSGKQLYGLLRTYTLLRDCVVPHLPRMPQIPKICMYICRGPTPHSHFTVSYVYYGNRQRRCGLNRSNARTNPQTENDNKKSGCDAAESKFQFRTLEIRATQTDSKHDQSSIVGRIMDSLSGSVPPLSIKTGSEADAEGSLKAYKEKSS